MASMDDFSMLSPASATVDPPLRRRDFIFFKPVTPRSQAGAGERESPRRIFIHINVQLQRQCPVASFKRQACAVQATDEFEQ